MSYSYERHVKNSPLYFGAKLLDAITVWELYPIAEKYLMVTSVSVEGLKSQMRFLLELLLYCCHIMYTMKGKWVGVLKRIQRKYTAHKTTTNNNRALYVVWKKLFSLVSQSD